MMTFAGLAAALAWAGPTAAPTATVLITSAATMAIRVLVNCDCDDILISLFDPGFWLRADERYQSRSVPIAEIRRKLQRQVELANFLNQKLVANPNSQLGTFATPGTSNLEAVQDGVCVMLGKLAGAWIGEKVAGRNEGAKGAIIGASAVAVGKRMVPTLAALALGGWAFKKWREHKRSHPSYPSDAEPRKPASETSSPS